VAKIGVINRTRERILDLQEQFGSQIIEINESSINDALVTCDLLINTTSLGMEGGTELALDIRHLKRNALVADIIYEPLETALLAKAKELGHPVLGGLGMLLHQAVRGFELWFGFRPEVTQELHDLVANDVQKTSKQ
jgi:shikimate dehydrogenase